MVHLQENGYEVEVIDLSEGELVSLKDERGIAPELRSCHTAEIGGYLVEGHVPADVIARLLEERPTLAGLAVPEMPPGSPGMDGELEGALQIIAFDRVGNVWTFTTWK